MLTRAALETSLWKAADILRGSIDSADYKNYIFGFLFLKRISDRFEEEAQIILKDTGDAHLAYDEPDEHRFYVPAGARWTDVGALATNIGDGLNKLVIKIEDANPKLEDILSSTDFNDERKLGLTEQRDKTLARLITHFNGLDLRNANLSEPDMMGRAYEYLIGEFADDAGKKGGEFYTPRAVVHLLVRLLEPQEGMRIYDPTCGSGGMLIEAAHEVQQQGGNPRNLTLSGQEKNRGTWAIAQMNMLMHDIGDFDIRPGDTIRDPQHMEAGELLRFDRVLANPPFSLDEWGVEVAQDDDYHRFTHGVPPKGAGDWAFIQHMIASTNGEGRMGVVVAHGVLFRGGAEGRIRQSVLKADLIDAVIGLPPNLFYGTGIPAALMLMRRNKPETQRGKVLFIDASHDYRPGKNQNFLEDAHIERIVAAYQAHVDAEKYATLATLEQIAANDYNLNLSRYVDTSDPDAPVDLLVALAELHDAEDQRADTERILNMHLRRLGLVT